MKVLIACEFSGRVRDAFIKLGHNAVSCDIVPSERPGPHIVGDVREVFGDGWDLMIAHPPCTFLSYAGCRWFKTQPDRWDKARIAFAFFMDMINAPIPKIVVENPKGYTWKWFKRPDQIVHPYYFGDPMTKATCFWLKGVDKLETTDIHPDPFVNYTKYKGGHDGKSRSRTFPGMAVAMAGQWGGDCHKRYYQLPMWSDVEVAI